MSEAFRACRGLGDIHILNIFSCIFSRKYVSDENDVELSAWLNLCMHRACGGTVIVSDLTCAVL